MGAQCSGQSSVHGDEAINARFAHIEELVKKLQAKRERRSTCRRTNYTTSSLDELHNRDTVNSVDEVQGRKATVSFDASSNLRYFAGKGCSSKLYDVFCSYAKKLPASEDRAMWVADLCELDGLRAFYDKSDLEDITETILHEKLLASSVCVTVIDPFTFDSGWVLRENLWATNAGIPIIPVYDADRFRWSGQLDKWAKLYPFFFQNQAIALTKSHRRNSLKMLRAALNQALQEGIRPPDEPIDLDKNAGTASVKIGVGGSRETETRSALETAHEAMMTRLGGTAPSLIVCTFTCTHNAEEVANVIHDLNPAVPMIGCTSCRGVVLNESWLTYEEEYALGIWAIADYSGAFTVVHITQRPANLFQAVVAEVKQGCLLREDTPTFVLMLGSPGDEEIVVGGIQQAVGDDVPIVGGSSADNKIQGLWRQISKTGSSSYSVRKPKVSESGITIAIAWCTCEVATSLVSGFQKTKFQGKVTKVGDKDNGRTILQIDGKNPVKVYDSWTQGKITKKATYNNGIASVLEQTAFCPIGEPCGDSYVRIIHPSTFNTKTGAISTFACVHKGMDVVLMQAAPEDLVKSMMQSAGGLLADPGTENDQDDKFTVDECVGALVIFCAGMVIAINDMMPLAVEQLATVVGRKNILGISCFGEQGMNHERKAIHGNLMFGCLLFSNKKRCQAAVPDSVRGTLTNRKSMAVKC